MGDDAVNGVCSVITDLGREAWVFRRLIPRSRTRELEGTWQNVDVIRYERRGTYLCFPPHLLLL